MPSNGTTGGGSALPCLYRNNCNEHASIRLSAKHRKSASALAWNVQAMADRYGLERLGFLTLTFRDHVLDPKEAQRRFRSLRTGILADRYEAFIRVFERQKSGRIHYHLIVVLESDIRTGFDFSGIYRKDYRSAGPNLRAEWAFWRQTAPRYGFGRTELLPIRSTGEGIARYVGKYIGKHMDAREERDKGVRLVEYSRGGRMASTRFSWHTDGAASWRRKVGLFVEMVAHTHGDPRRSFSMLRDHLGKRWAYQYREFILSLPDPETGEVNA